MKSKTKILEKYPELWQDIEALIEDVKFSQPHLVPMNTCECGECHEAIPGVMYRMCSKCRGNYAVRDEEYIKKHGEMPLVEDVDNFLE